MAEKPEALLAEGLSLCLRGLSLQRGALLLFERWRQILRLVAEQGLSEEGKRRLAIVGNKLMECWGVPLHGLLHRQAYLYHDVRNNPFVPLLIPEDQQVTLTSLASVPFYRSGNPAGVLILIGQSPRVLTEAHILSLEHPLELFAELLDGDEGAGTGETSESTVLPTEAAMHRPGELKRTRRIGFGSPPSASGERTERGIQEQIRGSERDSLHLEQELSATRKKLEEAVHKYQALLQEHSQLLARQTEYKAEEERIIGVLEAEVQGLTAERDEARRAAEQARQRQEELARVVAQRETELAEVTERQAALAREGEEAWTVETATALQEEVHLAEEIQRRDAELTEVRASLEAIGREREMLGAELEKLRQQLAQRKTGKKKVIGVLKEQIRGLAAERDKARRAAHEAWQRQEELAGMVAQRETELAEVTERQTALAREGEELRRQLALLTAQHGREVEEYRTQLDVHRQAAEAWTVETATALQEEVHLAEEIQRRDAELTEVRASLEAIGREREMLGAELEKLRQQLAQRKTGKKKVIGVLKEQIRGLAAERDKARRAAHEAWQRQEELAEMMAQRETELAEVTERQAALAREGEELRRQLTLLMDQHTQEVEVYQAQLEAHRQAAEAWAAETAATREERDRLAQKLRHREQELTEARTSLDALLKEREAELERLRNQLARMTAERKEGEERLVEELESRVTALEAEMRDLAGARDRAIREAEDLRRQQGELAAEREELLRKFQQQQDTLEAEGEELRLQVETYRTQLQESQTLLDSIMEERNRLVEEQKRLTSELLVIQEERERTTATLVLLREQEDRARGEPQDGKAAHRRTKEVLVETSQRVSRERTERVISGTALRVIPRVTVVDGKKSLDMFTQLLGADGYVVCGSFSTLEEVRTSRADIMMINVLSHNPDGWGWLWELKEKPETCETPVLAYVLEETTEKGFSFGLTDFVIRPGDNDQVRKRVERLSRGAANMVAISENVDALVLLREIFADHRRFSLSTACDGLQGAELVEMVKPDVVLLDLKMAKYNGFQVIEKLRKDRKTRYTPVVLFLEKTVMEDRNFLRKGAQGLAVAHGLDRGRLKEEMKRFLEFFPPAQRGG